MYLAIYLVYFDSLFRLFVFIFILFLLHICDTFFPSQSATHLFYFNRYTLFAYIHHIEIIGKFISQFRMIRSYILLAISNGIQGSQPGIGVICVIKVKFYELTIEKMEFHDSEYCMS